MEENGGGDALIAKIEDNDFVSCGSTSEDTKDQVPIDHCTSLTSDAVAVTLKEPLEDEMNLIVLFKNELIAEKIVGFLTLSDMKAVSEVSVSLCRTVRATLGFSEKAMLLICKETVGLKHFLLDTTYPWKLAQVDMSLPIEVIEVDLISHILETAQTLQMKIGMNENVDERELVRFIVFLLSKSPKLTTLQIESKIMEKVLYDVFSDLGAQAQLSKLKHLEICSWSLKGQATHYIDGTDGDEGPFPRNFLQLSLIPLSLETFKMAKICTITGSETEHVKFIPNIVSMNQDTLRVLSLHFNIWRLDDMKTIRCPNLKSLTVTAYDRDAPVLIAFLTNQPLLEELSVNMRTGFPIAVLSAIQGRCSKLKKLHIKGKIFNGVSGTVPVDWGFLSGITHLRDFRISRPLSILQQGVDQYGTGFKFLSVLPSHVKKIQFRGLDRFWYDPADAGWDGVPVGLAERISLLQQFHNVTHLSFMRCDDSFNNDVIQHVFSEFGQLRVLEISHCNALSDFGLTGIPSEDDENVEDTHISLKNLKALTEFKIRACPSISTAALIYAVELPYLRSFDYLSVIAVSKEFIVTIAKQNPSLESFSVFVSELESIQEIKGDLKNVNRRIFKFCNLNEEEWVDQDSDSDADSYRRFFDDDTSDISGGGYPADHDDFAFDDDFDEDGLDDDYDEDTDGFY